MRNLASAVALAVLCACAGYSSGSPVTGGIPTGGQSDSGSQSDAGDAGIDAGPDAGCAPLTLNTVGAIDTCPSGTLPVTATATVSVAAPDAGNACVVSINLTTGSSPCSGTASHGTLDAFTGSCLGTGLSCTSAALPGTLTCAGGCTITICPGGLDGGVCAP
ncbi:MAG TPA: hypothetical protein VFP52_12425 [Myxococcales bacterium]|nr:hypothetical protein [Myxococcales bacterium]